jgi:hypothetical protein
VTQPLNMLNHFPAEVSEANWREVLSTFLFVGITENIDESLRRMAALLGKPYAAVGRRNVVGRGVPYEHLRREFERNHPLELEVYGYARSLQAETPPMTGGHQG